MQKILKIILIKCGKKINENDKITFIITTKDMEMLKTL